MNAKTNLGEYAPDNLIYSADHPIDTKTVEVASGQGKLARGTLLKADGTKWASGDPDCILAEDVDATSAAVVAEAYRSGHFTRGAVITGAALTDAAEKTLADAGLYLSNAV
jgi:hypothetical protein